MNCKMRNIAKSCHVDYKQLFDYRLIKEINSDKKEFITLWDLFVK